MIYKNARLIFSEEVNTTYQFVSSTGIKRLKTTDGSNFYLKVTSSSDAGNSENYSVQLGYANNQDGTLIFLDVKIN